jgi:protein-tyrosine phosphatase
MKRVLFVCTGNICRSPTAEGVLRHHAAELGIEIDSAGTHGYHIGDAPDPRTVAAAKKRGYDLSPLRARKVAAKDFNDFDVIVAMDRSHHEALIAMAPAASKAELILFMDYIDGADSSDVPDPYYGEAKDFELVLDLVERGVQGMVGRLR